MITTLPADSVEFCPHPDAQDILACGTYKLEEGSDSQKHQKRRGQCLVFRVDTNPLGVRLMQEIDLSAVLDMKWCYGSPTVLAAATSNGSIALLEWKLEEERMVLADSLQCSTVDVLCLSLDWSNRRHPDSGLGSMIVSKSDGSLSLLRPSESSSLIVCDTWHAHDYEPWIAAWDYWNTNLIYSGGDDLKLKTWDIRQSFSQPILVNARFEAGLTAIQSNVHMEHIVAVGSYDGVVRIFDMRKPKLPMSEIDVGGGVWRVKWHPSTQRKADLAVACMHDGFKVVGFAESGEANLHSPRVLRRFDEHRSLAYGIDWSVSGSYDTAIASCSFYDSTLCLWTG